MSYRTKINGKQLFGNNEWYEEWGEYLISKGIDISDECTYEGELDNFMEALAVIEKITMNIEAKRRERKKIGEEFFSQSIFDNRNIYDNMMPFEEEYKMHVKIEAESIVENIRDYAEHHHYLVSRYLSAATKNPLPLGMGSVKKQICSLMM